MNQKQQLATNWTMTAFFDQRIESGDYKFLI